MAETEGDNAIGNEVDDCPIRDIRGPLVIDGAQSTDVDENVASHFPPGAKLQTVIAIGGSKWTEISRINLLLSDQAPHCLFLKVAFGAVGRDMLHGEYESVRSLATFAADFMPEPIAWGTYASDPNKHFYLASFVDMVNELPDREQFCQRLAKLHKDSIGRCPMGDMFGFHINTRTGWLKQDMTWTDSWEEYFARTMRNCFEEEEKINGEWKEMEELKSTYLSKVIPRLLRPLQSEGRTIEPVLLHNDIWLGNMAWRKDSGAPIVFDPASMWGHHEYELRGFVTPIYGIGREWVEQYLKLFPPSEPKDEYWDRYYLYSTKSYITVLILHPDPSDTGARPEALEKIKYLVDKYKDDKIPPKAF